MTKRVTLESIINERYGTTLVDCDSNVVEWAAMHLATLTDEFSAGQSWRKAESKRHRMGKYTSMPDYNNRLFDAFFAKTREEYEQRKANRMKIAA